MFDQCSTLERFVHDHAQTQQGSEIENQFSHGLTKDGGGCRRRVAEQCGVAKGGSLTEEEVLAEEIG